jgi:ribosomal protein S12 methylthiotransferase
VKYYLESLGCPKNLIDAHGMARLLKQMGHRPVAEARQAEVLLVNTCGFIEDAREESLDELRHLARTKRPGQVLIATGCLSQRWGDALLQAVPGLDGLLSTRRWNEVEALFQEIEARNGRQEPGSLTWLGDSLFDTAEQQQFARQGASAYLKIADGCSAPCAFCAIPLIKGPAASRPAAAIVRDAAGLVAGGVKEIVLIAQDTTAYGRDRGERDALPGLIEDILRAAPDLRWLRLMYAYPGHISLRLINVMAADPRICHYLDLPLQHAHPAVLRRMKRPADVARTRQLVADLRAAMPDLTLRTSFIVGYPGETEDELRALLDFVEEIRFDRVGVFLYSQEEETAAAALPNPVAEEVQVEHQDRLMALQQQISLEINQAQVGRTLDVLIEGQGDGLSVGRSYRDAPEIDGLVLVPGDLAVGKIAPVRITGALEYDLMGEPVLRDA